MDDKPGIGDKAKVAASGVAVVLGMVLWVGVQLLILGAVITLALGVFRWVFG